MSERLNGIEAFVAAVEAGNFASAAQRLGLTRSAVGKSVARIEERLGTRLFHRTTRSQRLTEDGQAYYERCRRALAELDAADAAIEAGRQTPAGRLRLTMPSLIGRVRVAPLLLELARTHPALTFDVSFSDRRADLVEDGFDLAVRSGPLGDSAVLAARLLGHQWMGVYASPGYLAAHGRPADLQALMADPAAHAYVGYARESGPHPWRFHDTAGRVVDFVAPSRFDFGCDSLEVAALAALQGLGLARLPAWLVADALADGRLLRVFEEPWPFGYELNAVWLRTRALPLKTRVVVDLLAERLPPLLAPPVLAPSPIDLEMAKRLAGRHARILNEFGYFSAEQLADANGSQAGSRTALADNWRKRRQVFAVPHPDKTARERDVYPAFQFEDGKPIKAVQGVLEAFGGRKAPWKLALWFTSNHGALPASARPVDMLATDPQAVVEAARRDSGESAA